jgi:O-antigen/teichoic acid export membrane protein
MPASIRKLANQTVIYGFSSIVPRFLNFLLVPLYTYYFSPAQYGVVADLYSWAVLLNIVATYGMETAFFRFAKDDKFSKFTFSTAFFSLLSSSSFFLLLVLMFSSSIASALGYSSNPEYVSYFAIIIAVDAVSAIFFVKLRLENKAWLFTFYKILNVVINVVLNFVFIILLPLLSHRYHFSYTLDVSCIFLSNLIASVVVFLLLLRYLPSFRFFNFSLLKKMLAYGIPLMLSGIAGAINDVVDRQFIKYFSPAGLDPLHELGIYFANVKIAVILILFIQTFRYAAEPFFFSHAREDDSKISFARIMLYYVVFSFGVFLFTYGNLPIFKYYIGSRYWSGLHIVPVVLFANVFVGIYLNLSMWYKLADKTMFAFYIIVVGMIITVVLDFIYVPRFGYFAAAYSRLLSYIVMTVVCYFLGKKYYSIPYNLPRILRYSFIAIILFVVQYFCQSFLSNFVSLLLNNFLFVLYFVYFIYNEHIHFNFAKILKR